MRCAICGYILQNKHLERKHTCDKHQPIQQTFSKSSDCNLKKKVLPKQAIFIWLKNSITYNEKFILWFMWFEILYGWACNPSLTWSALKSSIIKHLPVICLTHRKECKLTTEYSPQRSCCDLLQPYCRTSMKCRGEQDRWLSRSWQHPLYEQWHPQDLW